MFIVFRKSYFQTGCSPDDKHALNQKDRAGGSERLCHRDTVWCCRCGRFLRLSFFEILGLCAPFCKVLDSSACSPAGGGKAVWSWVIWWRWPGPESFSVWLMSAIKSLHSVQSALSWKPRWTVISGPDFKSKSKRIQNLCVLAQAALLLLITLHFIDNSNII